MPVAEGDIGCSAGEVPSGMVVRCDGEDSLGAFDGPVVGKKRGF